MGTNYYLVDTCSHCGHETQFHIGKSSGGWVFAVHIYPDKGLKTWADWKEFLKDKSIEDEYGIYVELNRLIEIVENRKSHTSHTLDKEWYSRNYAEPGPNGLVRSKVDGTRCVGHGEGTWDYFINDFS